MRKEEETQKTANPAWPEWYDGRKISETGFCRWFLERHPMQCVGGRLFTVNGPVEDETQIRQMILEEIQPYITSGISRKVTGLLDVLKLQAYAPSLPVHADRIHLANGTLFLNGRFTEEKEFCSHRLAVAYHPDAPRPKRWLQFLSELLEPEDIPTLQEFLGYCLIPSTKGQKMMMLIGKGGEGKSRIGLVLNAMFGRCMNTGSVQKIESNRFARADLENRLLLVDDDMDLNALPKTNYLKSIVTAETAMDVERKGVQSYQAQLYVRFLCFGNGALGSLYDHSDGFYRRQLILTVKPRPAEREDDPFLAEELCGELDGIFLWCLRGLVRLIRHRYRFTVSEKSRENVETVRRNNNNIVDFLHSTGYIRFGTDTEASSRELYEAYRLWCGDNACRCLSASRLSSELAQNEEHYNVKATNNIYLSGGRRVRGFTGIEVLVHMGTN